MRIAKAAVEADFPRSARHAVAREKEVPQLDVSTTAQLKNALAREDALLRDKSDLLARQATMAQEFEHRLLNSLQLIVSMLSLQSRAATTAEAATQLKIAANRVAALGRVHRQLWTRPSVEFSVLTAIDVGIAAKRVASFHGSTSIRASAESPLSRIPLVSSQIGANGKWLYLEVKLETEGRLSMMEPSLVTSCRELSLPPLQDFSDIFFTSRPVLSL